MKNGLLFLIIVVSLIFVSGCIKQLPVELPPEQVQEEANQTEVQEQSTEAKAISQEVPEIIEPENINEKSTEIAGFLNDLMLKLHEYNMIIRNLQAENKIMKNKMDNSNASSNKSSSSPES